MDRPIIDEKDGVVVTPRPMPEGDLVLAFNNDTILYGMQQLKTDMTRDEATDALEAAGFEEVMALAFLSKMYLMGNLTWFSGRLMLPTGAGSHE